MRFIIWVDVKITFPQNRRGIWAWNINARATFNKCWCFHSTKAYEPETSVHEKRSANAGVFAQQLCYIIDNPNFTILLRNYVEVTMHTRQIISPVPTFGMPALGKHPHVPVLRRHSSCACSRRSRSREKPLPSPLSAIPHLWDTTSYSLLFRKNDRRAQTNMS